MIRGPKRLLEQLRNVVGRVEINRYPGKLSDNLVKRYVFSEFFCEKIRFFAILTNFLSKIPVSDFRFGFSTENYTILAKVPKTSSTFYHFDPIWPTCQGKSLALLVDLPGSVLATSAPRLREAPGMFAIMKTHY